MTDYNIITTIERIPFVIDPKTQKLMQRITLRTTNYKQKETFALVVKFFADAYGEWRGVRATVHTEKEFTFCYEAKDYEDAQREMDKIKNEAFKSFGAVQIRNVKKKFKVKIQDENPEFEKLCNNLGAMGIYLEVKMILED